MNEPNKKRPELSKILYFIIVGVFPALIIITFVFTYTIDNSETNESNIQNYLTEQEAEKCGALFMSWGETIEWADGESVNDLTEPQLQGFHDFMFEENCVKGTDMVKMRNENVKLFKNYDDWIKKNPEKAPIEFRTSCDLFGNCEDFCIDKYDPTISYDLELCIAKFGIIIR